MSFSSVVSKDMTLKESAIAMGVAVPLEFLCPLTNEIIIHPLMTIYSISIEREAIISWLQTGNGTCPVTNKSLILSDLVPNKALEEKIFLWSWKNMLPEPKKNVSTSSLSNSSLPYISSDYPVVIGIVSKKEEKKIKQALFRRIETKMFRFQ